MWERESTLNGFHEKAPEVDATKARLLHAKVRAFIDALQEHTEPTKAVHISLSLSENFNNLLVEAGREFPELAEALPRHISSTGAFYSAGKAEATYLDVEIYARQIANMLGAVDGESTVPERPRQRRR